MPIDKNSQAYKDAFEQFFTMMSDYEAAQVKHANEGEERKVQRRTKAGGFFQVWNERRKADRRKKKDGKKENRRT